MALHLVEISQMVTPGAHAVLLLDQAGWHLSDKLDIPDNITLMPLPPKSPELNPVENIWQFMRDNWLSNRVFRSYDDILEHCCYAWNKLTDQPWTEPPRDYRRPFGLSYAATGVSSSIA
jgi:transposase